jgi:potassium-transporting ATPase KdpC subunit
MIRRQLITALGVTVALTVLLGVLYPLAVWGVGRAAFRHLADGSFVTQNGKVVGSSLIGQSFSDKDGNPDLRYFQPRPSAAGDKGYDAMNSSSSNYGPSNQKFLDAVKQRVADYRTAYHLGPNDSVPVDAVTASGSGLDPQISVANALIQARTIATRRRMPVGDLTALVLAHTADRQFGVLGEKAVNVLELNLALDQAESR